MSNNANMMQIVGAVERAVAGDDAKKKSWWTTIGVAFQNNDGSWNLRFDYLPARLSETTIQLRRMEPKDGTETPPKEPRGGEPRRVSAKDLPQPPK